MKKLCTVVIFLCASLVFTALWFSPLCALGTPQAYSDNVPIEQLYGLCYPQDTLARVDFRGSDTDLYRALDKILAKPVKSTEEVGALLIYAYSPRVCAPSQFTEEGDEYNVMAVLSDGNISIGVPVLAGCY